MTVSNETDLELVFPEVEALTLGVELELQIASRRDGDLTPAATELLGLIARKPHQGDFKPEITESMIEVSTGIHRNGDTLAAELQAIRSTLLAASDRLNLLICGGGAHPFQHWAERKIFDTPRFHQVSALYGYLAKQFTVFGQHIHIGCPNGDEAIFLLHTLSRYIPHFIALSAASPYYQGVDTAFDTARLNAISAFPLSGRAPLVHSWAEFVEYYQRMKSFGVIGSMKDFYWDIRPKPEFGTVEIRICDTPLTIERAAALSAYAQTLCRYLSQERKLSIHEDLYAVYPYNRFQAARFGFEGLLIDPVDKISRPLHEDLRITLARLAEHALDLGTAPYLDALKETIDSGTDAAWMRKAYAAQHSFADLVWQQALRWRGEA